MSSTYIVYHRLFPALSVQYSTPFSADVTDQNASIAAYTLQLYKVESGDSR